MNAERNLFNPIDLELSRSTFHFNPTRSGTCFAGRLIPAFEFEVLPGDSIKMDLNILVKMATPVYPTMDNLFMDVYFFFVPNKLVLGRRYGTPDINDSNTSWKAVIGAQDNLLNMPVPAKGVSLSPVKALDFQGSIYDYFNVGGTGSAVDVNPFPTLSYLAVWNENFRDPNSGPNPVTWGFGSNGIVFNGYVPLNICKAEDGWSVIPAGQNYGTVNALVPSVTTPVTGNSCTYMYPLPTCRFHGYFGSCLPWPQRNSVGVELPLGDAAPVVTMSSSPYSTGDSAIPLYFRFLTAGQNVAPEVTDPGTLLGTVGQGVLGPGSTSATVGSNGMVPGNLYADLSSATAANVNALRTAIQQQRWYEKLARSGNRYDELKYGLFGVRSKDSGDDRPIYLGGKRIPLQVEMVASTEGGTASGSAQGGASLGQLGAFSHTNDNDHYFYHSFDDWGTLLCVFTIRHHTTINRVKKKLWKRFTRDDYYFPTFAHLGEMAVTKDELSGLTSDEGTVFGYQECWEDYRWEPDQVSGLLRPNKNLGFMTYAEDFGSVAGLGEFLNASYQIQSVDKTLSVKSYASGFQFVYQFNFDFTARRCLPVYSIPGLMDHF